MTIKIKVDKNIIEEIYKVVLELSQKYQESIHLYEIDILKRRSSVRIKPVRVESNLNFVLDRVIEFVENKYEINICRKNQKYFYINSCDMNEQEVVDKSGFYLLFRGNFDIVPKELEIFVVKILKLDEDNYFYILLSGGNFLYKYRIFRDAYNIKTIRNYYNYIDFYRELNTIRGLKEENLVVLWLFNKLVDGIYFPATKQGSQCIVDLKVYNKNKKEMLEYLNSI